MRCTTCARPLEVAAADADDERLRTGLLVCPSCHVAVPVLAGFPLFGEARIDLPDASGDLAGELARLSARLLGTAAEYRAFLRAKARRPSIDAYAAFGPFNESLRALEPLVATLREHLEPGDHVLDLWCRTGWTGELLASLFPEQRVLAVWQNGADVLGYRGFRHWLGAGRRRPNLDVLFLDPNDPLPFEDHSFALVHGYDTLHRYRHRPLIAECLRVCKRDGAIAFPHVHLTNSDPQPFFERGETQLHGRTWARHFERVLAGTGRRAFVLSERRLFEEGDGTALVDEPDTEHYNACIVLLPADHAGRTLAHEPRTLAAHADARLVGNPLVSVDPTGPDVRVDPERLLGEGRRLFERHPVYERWLERSLPARLAPEDRALLYWGERQHTVREIARRVERPLEDVLERVRRLEQAELVRVAGVSADMVRLQRYFAEQVAPTPAAESTLGSLWRRAVERSGDADYLVWTGDGSAFGYRATDEIARRVATFLRSVGVGPGDRLLIEAVSHPEFVFAFWGATLAGALPIPFHGDLPPQRLARVLETARPKLALIAATSDGSAEIARHGTACFALDAGPAGEDAPPSFLEAVVDCAPCADEHAPEPDDPAVVLFTSGSTGEPKGVVLTHAALVRSSQLLDRAYAFEADDRLLATGTPHTMSGLRNVCVTPLHAGLAVVLAGGDDGPGPLSTLAACAEHGVTILNTAPAFLAYGARLARAGELDLGRVRMVLCTASTLDPALAAEFERAAGCPVYDYYGLTETAGACIFVTEREHALSERGIGRPLGALAALLDDEGREVEAGAVGELTLLTDNRSPGYLTADGLAPAENVRAGWLRTGDLARRTRDGCLALVGRKDRLLVDRNGENVPAEAIERELGRLDGVVACHVARWRRGAFDEIAALVEPEGSLATSATSDRPGAEWHAGLRERLRDLLPPAQVPTIWIAVPDAPVGATGKWDRAAVERLLAAADEVHAPIAIGRRTE